MSGEIALRPECPKGHGFMELLSIGSQTPEQRWCGVWYECPRDPRSGLPCLSAALLPSPELVASGAAS